jgi:exodeoxyribonuclease V gamma subunit
LLERVLAPLEDWLSDCQSAQFDAPLALSVVRSHWLAQMDAASLQRRFIGGGVQFATLMPMRAIPFKVVCMLGMNDGDYPRAPTPRDFDLMSQAGLGRAGDRARREDDRYLFLEAVLSARQRLYVSWQGRRASDHAVLPASVLVGQLLDHLNLCHQRSGASGVAFKACLQPLQAFSSQYFDAASGFFTYDEHWATARTTAAQLNSQPAALPAEKPLTQPPERAHNSALKLLLRRPQEVYFLHHLQARLDLPPTAQSDDEPFAPDGLTYFILQQELFNSEQPQATLTQWKLQGRLALGAMGELQQTQMLQLRETLLNNLQPWLTPQDGSELHINLRPGRVLQSKHPSLYTLTDVWIDHLSALAAGEPSRRMQCGSDALLSLSPLSAPQAQALLDDLQEVYAQAWAQPLPLACKTACAWLRTQAYAPEKNSPAQTAQQAQAAARVAFEGGFGVGEVQQSPYLQRAFEQFDDVWPAMQTWAERVYGPLLQAVRVESVWDTEAAEETEP